jgi:biotin carboxyl carrier protein
LRSDILIADAPAGMGGELVELKSTGGQILRLHAFELSLARMLDGRRRAQDVVDRAVQLGLPLGLPALDGFIRELEEAKLVHHGSGGSSPWQARHAWRPTERTLFQAALRAARQGKTNEARQALDQLLVTSPSNADARQLRAALNDEGARGFRDAYLRSERAWLSDSTPSRAEMKAIRPSFGPMAVLAALALSLLIGFFVPFPRAVNVPATLKPVATVDVAAPHDANVESVVVSEGQHVREGDVLYTDAKGAVHTPITGVVSSVLVFSGKATQRGQQTVTVEDRSKMLMTVRIVGSGSSAVKPGQTATLSLGDKSLKTVLHDVHAGEAHAVVEDPNGELAPGAAAADIDVPAASLFQRLR